VKPSMHWSLPSPLEVILNLLLSISKVASSKMGTMACLATV
jgi:hypothetical protein